MNKSRRQWKAYAREMLSGNYLVPVVGMLVVMGVNIIGSELAASLFPGRSLVTIIIGQAFMFIFSLIASVLSAGLSYMYLNIARGKAYSLGNLNFLFKNHPDRVIVAAFVLALIDLAASIPYYYVSYTSKAGDTLEEQVAWMGTMMFYLLLAMVLNMLFTLPFVMTYYLLADHLELGGLDALKMSMRMMKGNKGKYLLLQLSFVPLLILSAFTMYIGLLWLIPYMQMSSVMFYRDLAGEFDPFVSQPPLPEMGTEDQNAQDHWNKPGDDYNSEA